MAVVTFFSSTGAPMAVPQPDAFDAQDLRIVDGVGRVIRPGPFPVKFCVLQSGLGPPVLTAGGVREFWRQRRLCYSIRPFSRIRLGRPFGIAQQSHRVQQNIDADRDARKKNRKEYRKFYRNKPRARAPSSWLRATGRDQTAGSLRIFRSERANQRVTTAVGPKLTPGIGAG
ncbi:hypothetical protein GCM10011578_035810 [Streptomyces fuscichromogenes]|uniref:Uncharacterized protein n=1 Tax=Streptomyces fuscichromogenes TaxID=1324013 RepID=A0A918CRF2_9ACTN|nr:hypothetical protein GCM10011578_035810 [Streptomyces fuscichromogenes]